MAPARSQPRSPAPGVGLVMAILAAAACSGSASPLPSGPGASAPPASASPSASPSAVGAAALILRVTTEGGFIGPAANLNAIPEVSVYADGRILTPGPIPAIYPGPLLPVVDVRDVGRDGALRIIAAIHAAGLDAPSSGGGSGGVAGDTGTTVFAVTLDGPTATTRLVLGGGPPGVPGGLASPDPRAQAAGDLLSQLTDPSVTWGATAVQTSVLEPVAYRVYAAPGAPSGDATTEPAVAWPLATPLSAFGVPAVPDRGITGLRQGAVFGADAATLGPVLAAATSQTAFISGAMLYTLYVRPLLPDEVPAQG